MVDDRIEEAEERQLILRDKAAREGFDVPDEVLAYIAEKYAVPQTLKGALINVSAYASRRGIPVTLDVARLVLDGIRPGAAPEPVPEPVPVPELEPAPQPVPVPVPEPEPAPQPVPVPEPAPQPVSAPEPPSLEETLASLLDAPVIHEASPTPSEPLVSGPAAGEAETLFVPEAPVAVRPVTSLFEAQVAPEPATVWFAGVRTRNKESLVKRAGRLLQHAGLDRVVADGDLVAVKLHFGEEGNTGFVHPVFIREVVRLVREAGGKPFLTDSNTLYRGKRANAVDHLECAVHNGFSFSTVGAPVIIADGIDGREAVDVPIDGYRHFDTVRIGSSAVHADAMIVVTHVKGHEATGFGGALKNVGMGLGSRSAKQRMHSDLKPHVTAETCTACARCVTRCPVDAITITSERVARIDHDRCHGCGECVAACPHGAIAIQWKTEPDAIQEKIVEHVAGALSGKEGKVAYLSLVTNVTPDCDCWHFSDAAMVADIGVLASTDIVAIDQASYDLVRQAQGLSGTRAEGLEPGSDKFRTVSGIDGEIALAYAERHALGRRTYELRTLD